MTAGVTVAARDGGAFERETAIVAEADGAAGGAPGGETGDRGDGTRWRTHLSAAWNIGETLNGGYALTPVLRALAQTGGHPDPLSVTTHFLRPATGDLDGVVTAEPVRIGRTTGVVRGSLAQDGRERLHVTAVFGEPAGRDDRHDPEGPAGFGPPAPGVDELPPPEACVDRRELNQGVELPILSRVEVRIRPDHAIAGRSGRAVIAGWIRFVDGTEPSVLALPLFADAFPPSLYPLLGEVGWVPTIELTVHVRRRPAPGWVRARFECDDLHGGRMIESGTLWDASGRVVARSRQLGLHLPR